MSIFDRIRTEQKPDKKKKTTPKKQENGKLDLGFRTDEWSEEERMMQRQYLKEFGWVRIR